VLAVRLGATTAVSGVGSAVGDEQVEEYRQAAVTLLSSKNTRRLSAS
jgi:hypothetical protein